MKAVPGMAALRKIFRAVLAVLLCWCPQASSQSVISDADLIRFFGEAAPYRDVFQRARTAIEVDDREGFARLIMYPFAVDPKLVGDCLLQTDAILQDEAEFLAHFESVITPQVRQLILDQEFDDLNISWRGLGYTWGVVWIVGHCIDDGCTEAKVGIAAIHTSSASSYEGAVECSRDSGPRSGDTCQ